jgi:NTP pyrophosphatase (non-canonical NTP hydrolase)
LTKTEQILQQTILNHFRDYSRWTVETSMHKTGEDAIVCCLLGLLGETHEYIEKLPHWRSQKASDEETQAELGDVLYYLAHLIYRLDLINDVFFLPMEEEDVADFEMNGIAVIAKLQEQFKKVMREYSYDLEASGRKDRIVGLINELLTLVYKEADLAGWDFLEILEDNQAKLTSRKDRGVIGGDGDAR